MNGVVIEYKQDKGFGFLKDESETKYFFHISNVVERNKFLNKLTDYFYSDYLERSCYVVDFTQTQNEKGLAATNIRLTRQIFNDLSDLTPFEVVITDVQYYVNTLTRLTNGIKKGMSKPIGATAGGNGTFRLGYPEIYKELIVMYRRLDKIGWGHIESRQLALNVNGRSKITDNFIDNLKNKLIGKKTTVNSNGRDWVFTDTSFLRI